jgi:hypothetical protein
MDINDKAPPPNRACFVCGKYACFGFNTRSGDVWTCLDHRPEGQKRPVAPVLSRYGATSTGH